MGIRNNEYSYEHLMALVETEMKELEELKNSSTLQYGANTKKINELFVEIVNPKE
jgi:hypothetical protein